MSHSPAAPRTVSSRRRRLALAVAGATAAPLLVAVLLTTSPLALAVSPPGTPATLSTADDTAPPSDASSPPTAPFPFAPSAEDGVVSEGTAVTPADVGLPAVGRLDAALLEALRRADADAAADGIRFHITSGWRSAAYQRRLLDEAIVRYGSEDIARRWVATPESSRHVTGDAVDIGPIAAQTWLSDHGARYGLCRTYANEAWHFELATEPEGACPPMKPDAAG